MRLARLLIASLPLLLATGVAAAQGRAGEWVSYRDAYRAMVVFEKYGGAKNFLQNHLQVAAKEKGGGEGLQLTLAGKSSQLSLPLDPLGRTVFPLLKAAYDENAVLVLNRKGEQFLVRPRVSIVVRPDGVYDAADLRAACGQALGYARYADASLRGKQCVGVRFVFAKKAGDAGVRLRRGDGTEGLLPVAEGAAFAGDAEDGFPAVSYRFGAERAQVVTAHAPLAIAPLFE